MHKESAHELKSDLKVHGIEAFVAHDDIEPLKEWRDAIAQELRGSDSLIVLLTDDFEDKAWALQEVGYARCLSDHRLAEGGQKMPMLAVAPLGGKGAVADWGYLADFQAMSWSEDVEWDREVMLAKLAGSLLGDPTTLGELLIQGLQEADTFDEANRLAGLLPRLDHLSPQQVGRIVDVFRENNQVHFAYDLLPKKGDSGSGLLADRIFELTGRSFEVVFDSDDGVNELREVSDG